uniref:Uncharacterized protein n=1 Tax=Anguilla anguilla TaxID=7936 RepID=A0A0E9SEE3_ANGAN
MSQQYINITLWKNAFCLIRVYKKPKQILSKYGLCLRHFIICNFCKF